MAENKKYKILNGIKVEMTNEEITAMQAEQAKAEAAERTRPLTESEVSRLLIKQQINTLTVDDQTALRMVEYYPAPDAAAYAVGDRIQYNGKLYKCLQAHTAQADWNPVDAPSLWAEVLAGQDGTEIGEWVQPDSTNPYMRGDKVMHNGKTWVSTIDNNVWEPGTVEYWKEV